MEIEQYTWYEVTEVDNVHDQGSGRYPGTFIGSRVFSLMSSVDQLLLYKSSYFAEGVKKIKRISENELDLYQLLVVLQYTKTTSRLINNSQIVKHTMSSDSNVMFLEYEKQIFCRFMGQPNYVHNLTNYQKSYYQKHQYKNIDISLISFDRIIRCFMYMLRNGLLSIDLDMAKILYFELAKYNQNPTYNPNSFFLPIRLVDNKGFYLDQNLPFSPTIMYHPPICASYYDNEKSPLDLDGNSMIFTYTNEIDTQNMRLVYRGDQS